jgi:folate-binding protein YgfZ
MPPSLRDLQKECGARFASFFETELPAHYGDVAAEWNAVRHGCGIIDAGHRALLCAVGSERTDFLQGMLSNDLRTLKPGGGLHAAYLTVQGRVVSDMRVFALADEIWLDVPVQRRSVVRETLEKYIVADDVELIAGAAVAPLLSLEGPKSAAIAAAVLGEPVGELEMLAHAQRRFGGTELRVARVSHGGENGFLIFGEVGTAAALWRRSVDVGAVPVGIDALDILRIEAGIPWCDRDMDESFLAPEVGLGDAISYKKGCYIGQEVVERVASRGQVQRKLMGLVCDGEHLPPPGSKLSRDDEDVGNVTSAVRSPALRSVIALAYVRRAAWEPDTMVHLETGSAARVTKLPFYTPAR